MVGFGEVDEFEVEAEGAGEAVGGGEGVDVGVGEVADLGEGLLEAPGGVGGVGLAVGFAAGDGGAAERFDDVEEGLAGLLFEDFAEERSEGSDVAAEGCFLEFAGGCEEFGEALGPVGGGPM